MSPQTFGQRLTLGSNWRDRPPQTHLSIPSSMLAPKLNRLHEASLYVESWRLPRSRVCEMRRQIKSNPFATGLATPLQALHIGTWCRGAAPILGTHAAESRSCSLAEVGIRPIRENANENCRRLCPCQSLIGATTHLVAADS